MQLNAAGNLLQPLLGSLVLADYIGVPAAVACFRAAFTSGDTSRAMTNLHTASALCGWLIQMPCQLPDSSSTEETDTGSEDEQNARIVDSYAACGVSLADLVPTVSPLRAMRIVFGMIWLSHPVHFAIIPCSFCRY